MKEETQKFLEERNYKLRRIKYKCSVCCFSCKNKILFEENCPLFMRNETTTSDKYFKQVYRISRKAVHKLYLKYSKDYYLQKKYPNFIDYVNHITNKTINKKEIVIYD